MKDGRIRVLVVDDSALMRKKITEMISSDKDCKVVAVAKDGEEALRYVATIHPDVISLDLALPGIDGVTALKYIMSEWPTPTVILTGVEENRKPLLMKCLDYGAIDFVIKPGGVISRDIEKVRDELLVKIKAASRVNMGVVRPALLEGAVPAKKKGIVAPGKIVVIASSTGGPKALSQVLPKLAADLPATILVVQHMPEGFTQSMAERFNMESKILVKEAENGESLKQAEALVAPAGFQLGVEKKGKAEVIVRLEKNDGSRRICPSADVTMKSVASLYGKKCLGVVLTGMGNDGTEGLQRIKELGGRTIAQDKNTSIIYGMPKAAADAGAVDTVLPLQGIADEISRWVKE